MILQGQEEVFHVTFYLVIMARDTMDWIWKHSACTQGRCSTTEPQSLFHKEYLAKTGSIFKLVGTALQRGSKKTENTVSLSTTSFTLCTAKGKENLMLEIRRLLKWLYSKINTFYFILSFYFPQDSYHGIIQYRGKWKTYQLKMTTNDCSNQKMVRAGKQ